MIELLEYRESAAGPWIPACLGKAWTSASQLEFRAVWPEADLSLLEIASGLSGSATLPFEAEEAGVFRFSAGLPEPDPIAREIVIQLTAGGLEGELTASLKSLEPRIRDAHARSIVQDKEKLYFTLAFRVLAEEGDLSGAHACITVAAGSGLSEIPVYQHSERVTAEPGQWVYSRIALPLPAAEDTIYLAVSASDRWGNTAVWTDNQILRRFLVASSPPVPGEYDRSTQETANLWPVWAAVRHRDYLALAGDPHLRQIGARERYHAGVGPSLRLFDFNTPPVGQRVLNALSADFTLSARHAIEAVRTANSLRQADVGQPGSVWRARKPEGAEEPEIEIESSAEAMMSGPWTPSSADGVLPDWAPSFPDEFYARRAGEILCDHPSEGIRFSFRARAEGFLRGTTPDVQLKHLEQAGSFGAVWRKEGETELRLAWGWRNDVFGISVIRLMEGLEETFYQDEIPRPYSPNDFLDLEIADHLGRCEIRVNGLQLCQLHLGPGSGRAGLFSQPSGQWQAYFGAVGLALKPESVLYGLDTLVGEEVELEKIDDIQDFLEAPPTRLHLRPAAAPRSGIAFGPESDPVRRLVEGDGRIHRVLWWTDEERVVKGEQTNLDPVFSYRIWDDRPRADLRLIGLVLRRQWLWVLGEDDDGAFVYMADPKTPDPLEPSASLRGVKRIALPVLGASGLARSGNSREVFVQ